ncbi:MAG: sporulation protein [Candidatus Muiribacterium halophilum]|uniref:Sporulation protein n=1 Tax=Muiribacterium halophilum TaxID=2053465 RepID=A0A2N5Z9M1_MUIH1|nr:MAG: sporulation protein [Candidatus Muirbacterium halophilum]
MALDNIVKTLIEQLKDSIQCQTVVGQPVQAGDTTIIPVSKVSFGFAAGGGEKKKLPGFGAGTGGGASVEPVAFIVVQGDQVRLLPVNKGGKWMDKLLDPENYERLNEVFSKIIGEKTGKNKKHGKNSEHKKED